jgi:hypothetical protein
LRSRKGNCGKGSDNSENGKHAEGLIAVDCFNSRTLESDESVGVGVRKSEMGRRGPYICNFSAGSIAGWTSERHANIALQRELPLSREPVLFLLFVTIP